MIIHNITYAGKSLADSNAKLNNLVIQNVEFTPTLKTSIIENLLGFGGVAKNPTGGLRLFTFSGQIFGDRAGSANGQAFLNNLTALGGGYQELSWDGDDGQRYKCEAQVYSLPRYTANIDNNIVDFTFELLSSSFEYFGAVNRELIFEVGVDITNQEMQGGNAGINLGSEMPLTLGGGLAGLIVNNVGNHQALCKIEVNGEAINPVVHNYTNGRQYRLNMTTQLLVIDNRNGLIVTNNGADCSSNRQAGSTSIVLSPGSNIIAVTSENDLTGAIIKVFFNDTYK